MSICELLLRALALLEPTESLKSQLLSHSLLTAIARHLDSTAIYFHTDFVSHIDVR